ncbi:glycerophosphodiester phosphodiesterase [Yinghuangia sp. YIM S09857]|uniref:glycerophosphodiester phosphodiesterase n=1 Tax=Yinghuangia sp. YIM S09857 TaxID=3436929 RepID=UPI003F52C0F0
MTTMHRAARLRRTTVLGLAALATASLLPLAASAPAGADPAAAANTAAPAPGEVVVSADFSSGRLPEGWRAVEGEWTVSGGRLHGVSASSGQQSRITFGQHLADFRFEATARFDSVADAARWTALGLDVPSSGAVPWSIATMRSGTTAANGLEFAQRTAANTWNVTDTAAAPSAAGVGRDVRIAAEVHGGQARWFFDGKEALRTSRVQRSADGGQALLVNGARVSFDDVKVTALGAPGYLRPVGSPLTVIAHRGASSAAPENTLVSDEIARRGGAEWIENDVQPSKDGVPHILHDTTVDRTTDGVGPIRTLTSGQLAALDAGSWFAPMYAGSRVPTLSAQLDDLRTRGGKLLLEIKGAHTRDEVARIVADIRAAGMTDRVFVQSFEVDALRYVRDLAPELPRGLLRSTLDADPVAISAELGLASYNPSDAALMTRPGIIADLHRAGVALMVWTVDSAARWQALEAAGVDAIITNRPAELAGWNAGFLQRPTPQPPAPPVVRVTGVTDGAALDRAQAPVVGAAATDADKVTVTLDGTTLAADRPLDLRTLPAGRHTVTAEAVGPGGTASATASFTIAVTPSGLAHVLLTSGAQPHATSTLMTMLAHNQWAPLANWAENQAGRSVPAPAAEVVAADARTLAGR